MRTIEEIEQCGKTTLSPRDVAGFLGCQPYSINLAAQQAPELLGFPVALIGSRVRIPRDGFVRWARGLGKEKEAAT